MRFKSASIAARLCPKPPLECPAKCIGICEADRRGDGIQRPFRNRETPLCFIKTQVFYELRWRASKYTFKSAIKVTWRHTRSPRQSIH